MQSSYNLECERYGLILCFAFGSARKPGPGGYGGVEAFDGLTPLHLACEAGQDKVVQCLVENNVNINAQVITDSLPSINTVPIASLPIIFTVSLSSTSFYR